MSIFDADKFLDKMFNIFHIEQCEYRNGHDRDIITRNKMLGIGESSVPVSRKCTLPPDMRSDYVLSSNKFECFVGEKRKWVGYSEIFDEDINNIHDLIKLVALNGDFDKNLPMEESQSHKFNEPEFDESENFYWFSYEPTPDYSKYWKVVAGSIENNILLHVRPGCKVRTRCVPSPLNIGISLAQAFRIELYVDEVGGEKCYWFNTDNILRGGLLKKNALFDSPSIIFRLMITKNES